MANYVDDYFEILKKIKDGLGEGYGVFISGRRGRKLWGGFLFNDSFLKSINSNFSLTQIVIEKQGRRFELSPSILEEDSADIIEIIKSHYAN